MDRWEHVLAFALMLGVSFLLGKVETHKNPPLVADGPTVWVESWQSSPECIARPEPGDTLIVRGLDGRAVAQVPIPTDTSYRLQLWQNFRHELTPWPRCSR